MNHRNILFSAMSMAALFSGGCARLDYKKVPTPTQYSGWTDEQQRKADAMKGVRYYLPRPFLHLKQSTPVGQRVALVSFELKNGKYELVLPQDAPSWLKRAAPKQISISQALAASLATNPRKGIREQSGPAGGASNAVPAAPGGGPDNVTTSNRPPSELHARTGFINESDPVTRLGERMDIVYLPDLEEQYVITPRTGLGTADIETRLRHGWAAEVFAQKVDNSNLIPYVIDQVERASEAAAGIFTTWAPVAAGLPPGTSPDKLFKLQSAPAGEFEKVARNILGEVLIFKIAEVKIAQPGVYPILKPREISQWLKYDGVISASDPDATFEALLKNAKTPWIRPDMAFIPCPPFTMIGFNVTTDIFISPATSVSGDSVGDSGNNPSDKATLSGPEEKIKTKLTGAKDALDQSIQSKVDWEKINISTLGSTSTLELSLTGKVDEAEKTAAQEHLKAWSDKLFLEKPAKVEIRDPETVGAFPAPAKAVLTFALGTKELAGKIKP